MKVVRTRLRDGALRVLVIVALVLDCCAASAVDPARESYRLAEAQRRDSIARQLDLNYRMIWQSGYGPRYPNPFEPWPRVPGDIWGYPMSRPIEHPVGYESRQTAPDRWTYRPVYAAELAASVHAADAAPPQAQNVARPAPRPGPSDLTDPLPAPAPRPQPAEHGPRAF